MVWDNTYGDFYLIEFTEINNTKVRIMVMNYVEGLPQDWEPSRVGERLGHIRPVGTGRDD